MLDEEVGRYNLGEKGFELVVHCIGQVFQVDGSFVPFAPPVFKVCGVNDFLIFFCFFLELCAAVVVHFDGVHSAHSSPAEGPRILFVFGSEFFFINLLLLILEGELFIFLLDFILFENGSFVKSVFLSPLKAVDGVKLIHGAQIAPGQEELIDLLFNLFVFLAEGLDDGEHDGGAVHFVQIFCERLVKFDEFDEIFAEELEIFFVEEEVGAFEDHPFDESPAQPD